MSIGSYLFNIKIEKEIANNILKMDGYIIFPEENDQ